MSISLNSYPASSWRTNQRAGADLIAAVCTSPSEIRIGVEAPCGSGKSLMAIRAAFSEFCPPCNILSTTRAHLRQYEQTLAEHYPDLEGKPDGWAILRGRSFYACCGGPAARARAATELGGPEKDPEEEWVGGSKCPRGDNCLYKLAIKRCAQAKIVLQCTIGFLYRRRYWGSLDAPSAEASEAQVDLAEARQNIVSRELVILDEAHEYLRVRREFELERMAFWPEMCTEGFRAQLLKARTKGNYKCSYVLLEPDSPLRHACEAEILRLLLPANLERLKPAKRMSDEEWAKAREGFADKLKARLALFTIPSAPPGEKEWPAPVLSLQFAESRRGSTCELVSEPLFARVGESLARVEVFMSATLTQVARLLKIPEGHVKSFPEIFDWGASVALSPLTDPDPDSRSNVAIGADQLEAIYRVPGRPLTLVLFVSKAHAFKAVQGWGQRAPGLLVQGEGELSDLLDEARKWAQPSACQDVSYATSLPDAPAPMVVTYGGWVGTDLPGAKWLVLGSAPKTPISPHHEARQARGRIRSAWDDAEKNALDRTQLAQGLGRALRSESDVCTLIWTNSRAFSDLGLDPSTGRVQD